MFDAVPIAGFPTTRDQLGKLNARQSPAIYARTYGTWAKCALYVKVTFTLLPLAARLDASPLTRLFISGY